MGNQETTDSKLLEKTALVDFLYIDKEKVDSFLSQIQSGALRSVKKTNDITQGSTISGEGKIPPFVKGCINETNQDLTGLEEQYDPYHSQLIELLNFLNPTILNDVPEVNSSGKIVLFKSQVSIRNLDTIKKTIPIIKNNKQFFGLVGKEYKNIDPTMKLIDSLLSLMPFSIDVELKFESGHIVNGPIKESALSIKSDDLFRSYGTQLPGKWLILGIIDNRVKLNVDTTDQSIYSMIDQLAKSMSDLYTKSDILISPILIFRPVTMIE